MIVDGHICRTINELLDNFNINDVLDLYEKGTLLCWLETRSFTDYAERVKRIDSSADTAGKTKALLTAFGFSCDDENAQQALYAVRQRTVPEEVSQACKTNRINIQKKGDSNMRQDGAPLHTDTASQSYLEYTALKEAMKQHSDNMSALTRDITMIEEKYMTEFSQDYIAFFNDVKNTHPLIVYCLLENKKTKKYLQDNTKIKDDIAIFQYLHNKLRMY